MSTLLQPGECERLALAPDSPSVRRIDQPCYLMLKQPAQWYQATLPERQAFQLRISEQLAATQESGLSQLHKASATALATDWKNKTGAQPEDCAFTLVMPIHDEEPLLNSALAALMLSRIPPQLPLSVVLITNACSDRSIALVHRFMESLGNSESFSVPNELRQQDSQLLPTGKRLRYGAATFFHLDTATASKANALNLANTFALLQEHRIAINIDANNWLEPGTLSQLYGDMRRALEDPDNRCVVVSATQVSALGPSNSWTRALFSIAGESEVRKSKSPFIAGLCFAWDTQRVEALGGHPRVAGEDYALSVMVRAGGFEVAGSEAAMWSYRAASLRDFFLSIKRSVRCRLQLMDRLPENEVGERVAALVNTDTAYLGSVAERLQGPLDALRSGNFLRIPQALLRFLVIELAVRAAAREHRRDPSNESWEPIASTK